MYTQLVAHLCSTLVLKCTHPLYFLTLGDLTLLLCDSFLESVSEETGDWPLDIDDLLRFSFQVAQGLDFLAAKNVSELTTKGDSM